MMTFPTLELGNVVFSLSLESSISLRRAGLRTRWKDGKTNQREFCRSQMCQTSSQKWTLGDEEVPQDALQIWKMMLLVYGCCWEMLKS